MEKKGVLIIVVKRGLYHVADSAGPASSTINNRFGRILPEDCLLTGDAERCRVNALLCNNQKDAGLYFHALEGEGERHAVILAIENLLHPENPEKSG